MKTTSELQHLASRYGWAVGPLTYAKIQRMSSDEALFNERLNTKEYNRALGEPKAKAENKANAEASKTQRMWSDQAAPDETQEALEEVSVFCSIFPQFRGDYVPNREALVNWLRAQNMAVTARNLVTAFQSLAAGGKLILNPAAIGIGTESELTGHKLKNHPQLWRLLEPATTVEDQEKQTLGKMSANDYKKTVLDPVAKQELGLQISRLEQNAYDRAVSTFTSMHPEYIVSEANRQKLVAYLIEKGLSVNQAGLEMAYQALTEAGELELTSSVIVSTSGNVAAGAGSTSLSSGVLSNASSLSRKINSMSAKEYSEWILIPANRKAADAITTGSSR